MLTTSKKRTDEQQNTLRRSAGKHTELIMDIICKAESRQRLEAKHCTTKTFWTKLQSHGTSLVVSIWPPKF